MTESFSYNPGGRRRPSGRLDQAIDAASRVFTDRGHRRTQTAMARQAGVSPGTRYDHVVGKEALFHLARERRRSM
jgi:AcrR family transcriptional regulator